MSKTLQALAIATAVMLPLAASAGPVHGKYVSFEELSSGTPPGWSHHVDFQSDDYGPLKFQGDYDYDHHDKLLGDTTAAVPEPRTYALMFGGLAIVGLMARRRRPR